MAGTSVCNQIKQESDTLSAPPQSILSLSPFSAPSEIRDTWFLGEGATHKLKPSPICPSDIFLHFPHFFRTSEFRLPYGFNKEEKPRNVEEQGLNHVIVEMKKEKKKELQAIVEPGQKKKTQRAWEVKY